MNHRHCELARLWWGATATRQSHSLFRPFTTRKNYYAKVDNEWIKNP